MVNLLVNFNQVQKRPVLSATEMNIEHKGCCCITIVRVLHCPQGIETYDPFWSVIWAQLVQNTGPSSIRPRLCNNKSIVLGSLRCFRKRLL